MEMEEYLESKGSEINGDIPKNDDSSESRQKNGSYARFLPAILFCVGFYCSNIGGFTIFPQYLLARLKREHNFTSESGNETLSPCNINHSDPLYKRDKEIQEMSSSIIATAQFIGGIPGLISVIIFGALSDRLGRKKVMYISYTGLLVLSIGLSVIINFDLPYYVYTILCFINGCCGSHGSMLAALFAYVADNTNKHQRPVVIAMIECSMAVSMIIISVIIGVMIRFFHFKISMLAMSSLAILTSLCLCCLEERRTVAVREETILSLLKSPFQNIRGLLGFSRLRSAAILILTISFTLFMLIISSGVSASTLYLLDNPFCWTSIEFGLFTALKFLVWMIVAFIIVAFLRYKLNNDNLVLVGCISFMASNILQGMGAEFQVPTCNIIMLASIPAGFLTSIPPILMRAEASRLVTPDEQGAMYGFISTGETLSYSFGSTFATAIYGATLTFLPGCFFFVGAFIMVVTFILMLTYKFISTKLKSQHQILINESDTDR